MRLLILTPVFVISVLLSTSCTNNESAERMPVTTDSELALEWFRESVETQATQVLNAWLPVFADLRHEPGFKEMLRDEGLPEYWERFGWPDFCRRINNDEFECD